MNRNNLTNNSTNSQKVRLLAALIEKSMNRYEIEDQLNIGSPAARIYDLKQDGHQIISIYERAKNHAGYYHDQIARYVLIKLAGGNHAAF